MSKIHIGNKIISKNPSNKLIKCCVCSNFYEFKNNLFLSYKGKILICPVCGLKHLVKITLFYGQKDPLVKLDELNLGDITMGEPAIERFAGLTINYTRVNVGQVADGTGTITSIEIFAFANITNCKVATFFRVSGNNLTARDSVTIGPVIKGAKRTFTVDSGSNPIALDVVAGDMIGIWESSAVGKMERGSIVFSGVLSLFGDQTECENAPFTFAHTTHCISLYATGETAGPEFKNSARTGIYSFKTLK